MRDCIEEQGPFADSKRDKWAKYEVREKCETVGQTTVTSWSMNVPPMQSRAYEESVYFSSLPLSRGTYRWNYRIVYVKGSKQHLDP